MAKRKSAFVKAGEAAQDIVKAASHTQRSNLTDDSEVIEMLKLKPGQRVSLVCKLVRILPKVYDDDHDLAGLPYVVFSYSPTKGPLKGGMLSKTRYCYDYNTKELSEEEMARIFREFQALGFDTADWTLKEIEETATEMTEEQPLVALQVRCYEVKSGKNKGDKRIDMELSRLLDSPSQEASDAPEDDDPEDQDEDDGGADDTDDDAGADDSEEYTPKVGDTVLYEYDEDGETETLTCKVTKVNEDTREANLSDDEYDYEGISWDDFSPAE